MGFLFKLMLVIVIIVGIGAFAIAQGLITIPFTTPIADTYIAKCGNNIDCYQDIVGSPVRFFTMIREDGSVEKIILIEDYPIKLRAVKK